MLTSFCFRKLLVEVIQRNGDPSVTRRKSVTMEIRG
uniref:Uncharacterized protein n=1 Tax=Ascaris lumbricoides TaxID=6252 RepID=A0A0M3ICC1_ASCLU